jgi:hypothetical protein
MAFIRNKKSSNPNRRKMSVDFAHPIFKENKKILGYLDEMDRKKCWYLRRK